MAKEKKDQSVDSQEKDISVDKKKRALSGDDLTSLSQQVKNEYELCHKHQLPKKTEAIKRLKLYNNQRRDKKAVGDTTLFTTFQTVLANLYVDKLSVELTGREDGDDESADNLTAVADYDYAEMGKDQFDFDWIWNTCFFGRGMVLMEEFYRNADKGIFVPLPEVIDNLVFLRDPLAKSVNGNAITRKGGARFLGWEAKMTNMAMEDNANIFDDLLKDLKYGTGTQMSMMSDAIEGRDSAQGRDNQEKLGKESSLGENAQYDVTIWFTHYKVNGQVKKIKVWLANEREKVIGYKVLEHDYWPIIDRPLYPTAQDWDGTSIPDLVEDKQRGRSVAQNMAMEAMKRDLYPMYIYDTNKIVNRKDLKFNLNKFIPLSKLGNANVNTAIAPLIKARPNMVLLDYIYDSLDVSAQKATATPDIAQGMQSEKDRPLGETNLIASKTDTRTSLSARIFGWSERELWRQWYQSYKDNLGDDIDEKIVTIQSAFGAKHRPFEKKDLTTRLDPNIKITSQNESRAQQLEERVSLSEYFGLVLEDPTANRRYAMKKLGRLYGMQKDEIDRLLPQTIDERVAEEENEEINEDNFVGVLAEQDHNVHLEVLSKAKDNDAKEAHKKAHEKALMIKKSNPEFFPEEVAETEFQQGTTPPPAQANAGQAGGANTVRPSQTSGRPT